MAMRWRWHRRKLCGKARHSVEDRKADQPRKHSVRALASAAFVGRAARSPRHRSGRSRPTRPPWIEQRRIGIWKTIWIRPTVRRHCRFDRPRISCSPIVTAPLSGVSRRTRQRAGSTCPTLSPTTPSVLPARQLDRHVLQRGEVHRRSGVDLVRTARDQRQLAGVRWRQSHRPHGRDRRDQVARIGVLRPRRTSAAAPARPSRPTSSPRSACQYRRPRRDRGDEQHGHACAAAARGSGRESGHRS